jgi:acyl-CoA thioester hydrolase
MSDYKFFHPIEVRYGDLDPQGHVNNAKYLTYFEQARVNYLIHLGLFGKDQSFMEIGIIIADVRVTFHAPVRFGDEVKVGVRTTRIGNKSMTLEQCVTDQHGKVMTTGALAIVTYDYEMTKTIPVPEDWRKKISEFEGL